MTDRHGVKSATGMRRNQRPAWREIRIAALCSAAVCAASDKLIVVVTNFYEALSSNAIDDAKALLVDPANLSNDGSTSFDIAKYYFFNASQEGDAALVKTATVNKKGTLSFYTVLEMKDGEWKINFDKTMSNMARAAIEEKQVGGTADLTIDGRER